MTHTSMDAHLDDGELMVLDDSASAPTSSAAAREHLASCSHCADRLNVLRQHSRRVSSLIAEIELPDDFRVPSLPAAPHVRAARPSWAQQHWRRAAAVLLVIGSLAAVSPLRAWTIGWVAKQIAALTGASHRDATPVAPPASQNPPPATPIDSGATLWFDAGSSELAVEVVSPQATGTLTLSPSPRPMTGVEVVNGAGETPLVREHGIRLLNNVGSTASYRLAVPSGVLRVRVRIGGQPWQTFNRADVETHRAVELRQR